MGDLSNLSMLAILVLLQLKHSLFDGPLQISWMLREKAIYGKPGGLVHAGLHGLGTCIAFMIFLPAAWPAAVLGVADAIIHYHVDFSKESLVRARNWTANMPQFWWALTADQLLHQLTYIALVAIVAG